MSSPNITAVRQKNGDRAVVFVHGFTGGRDDTWDRFPALLDNRPVPEQNDILLSVAQQMKEAALGATRQFKNQPSHPPVSGGMGTKTSEPL